MSEISINFTADVREIETGTKKVSDGLGTIEDALTDANKAGDKFSDELVRDFLESERAGKKSAEEIKDVLVKSYGISADAAEKMSRITKGELEEMADKADDVEDGFKKVDGAAGKVGDSMGDLGSAAKDALEGDMGGAIDTVAAGLGGLSPIAGFAAAGVGAVVGAALESITEQSEATTAAVSENFREMAANGIEAWSSFEAQSQRLTEAYDQHEGEIKKIADLVGLPFETVAAAWAGNETAVRDVTAAQAEMNEELRKTPGVSVDAANATIKGWEGVLAPLTSTLAGYDEATAKAERLAAQQEELAQTVAAAAEESESRQTAALQERFDALRSAYDEAAGRPPIEVKTNVQAPDVDSIFNSMQQKANQRVLVFRSRAVNSRGEDVD